jgi:hypothetical protein
MPPPNLRFGSFAPSLLQRLVLGLTRIPPLYRGSLRPTWAKIINLLRSGPVDVGSTYGNFRVYPKTNLVDSAILLHPAYNKEVLDFLKNGLPDAGLFLRAEVGKCMPGVSPVPAVDEDLSGRHHRHDTRPDFSDPIPDLDFARVIIPVDAPVVVETVDSLALAVAVDPDVGQLDAGRVI